MSFQVQPAPAHEKRADGAADYKPQLVQAQPFAARGCGKEQAPPARQQQEPCADRSIRTGQAQVRGALARAPAGPPSCRARHRPPDPLGVSPASLNNLRLMSVRPLQIRPLCKSTLWGRGKRSDLSREQANYLFNVMRLGPGAEVALFNGQGGEWRAVVETAGKRGGTLACVEQDRAAAACRPTSGCCSRRSRRRAPISSSRKATEMGAARILPVQTEFTNAERIRQEPLAGPTPFEAAEQCGGTFVPAVAELAAA